MSADDFNIVSGTVTVIPISSGRFMPGIHVLISDLTVDSHAVVPQLRCTAKERFIKKIGEANLGEMEEIEAQVKFFLKLI
jgi:mRNA-degrading endonuclease toxin of MazEF toxin-antitoxin module